MAKRPPNPTDPQTPGHGDPPDSGGRESAALVGAQHPSVDELATLLRAVVLVGIDHSTPTTLGAMFGLSCVRDRARDGSDEDDLTDAARDVLRDALGALGAGKFGRAARLLFGATDDTRGQTARERRRMAADQIDVMPDWFRRRYVPQITKDVATEVLKIERANTDDQTTPHDTTTGTAVVRIHDRPTDTADVVPAEGDARSGRGHILTRVRHLFRDPDTPTADTGETPVALASGPRALTPLATQPGQLQRVLQGLRDQQTRKDWHRVWRVGAVAVFILWGLTAVPRYVLVVAVLAAVKTATDMVRLWRATRSLALGDHWPRLILRICVVVVAGSFIQGDNDRGPTIGIQDCLLNHDIECPTGPTTDPHPSPYYTPTTYADPPTRASDPECPPPGNTEPRLAFNGLPPLCINPDNRYAATIRTNYGHFTVTLNTQDAPYTVNNFVYLARWHYYDGVQLLPSPQPTPLPTDVWTHLLSGHPVNPTTPDVSDHAANSDDPPDNQRRNDDNDRDQTTTTDTGEVGVPGYGLTFENHDGAYPDDQTLYLTMVNNWRPDQFAIIVTPEAHAQVGDAEGAYPLLGVIEPECRDVIAQRDVRDGWDVGPKSEAIIIEAIDITEEPGTTATTRATTPLPGTDPCGKLAATRND